jgi:hypothetical protein
MVVRRRLQVWHKSPPASIWLRANSIPILQSHNDKPGLVIKLSQLTTKATRDMQGAYQTACSVFFVSFVFFVVRDVKSICPETVVECANSQF